MTTTTTVGTPHAALRGIVLRYEGFTDSGPAPVTFRELPCSFVPIIIDLDAGWTVTHAGARAPTRLGSFVAGITESTVVVGHPGTACCVQLDLTPLGARRLLGIPLSDLANATVPIDGALGRLGHELVQRIGNVTDWAARFAVLDQFLLTRLEQTPPLDPGLAWSWQRISSTRGNVPINALAAELGWSHRRLIARYRDAVGLPPKLVARIVRFEGLAALLTRDPTATWADAAVECGYFDQPHLAREVRELAGVTPTGLRAELVNSVQDGPARAT